MSEIGNEEAYTDNVVGHNRFGGQRPSELGNAGGGGGSGLGDRVGRLEEWAKVSESRMSRVEDKLDQIIQRLAATPTRIDLLGAFVAALAVLSIVFAGLGWLETRAARVQPAASPHVAAPGPIVIQLPPYPAATAK